MQRVLWAGMTGLVASITVVSAADAQIRPDATLGGESSRVRAVRVQGRDGITRNSDLIEGGAQRGRNLFHSFEQFDVPEGRGAYFGNPIEVRNIFSRVTGADRSEINGTLGVLGDANLFFINPNGILFGPNSSLDVGGSFVGTTANAIGFGELGFFSATNPETPSSLLTIDPSAFLFNQVATQSIPSIENQGALAVYNGQNLLLLGGNVNLIGGRMDTFSGGRAEIGAVGGVGTVGLNPDGSLSFSPSLVRADVSLLEGVIDVRTDDSGSIGITGRNINLSSSSVLAGIGSGFRTVNSQAGDINLDASETLRIGESSLITNRVFFNALGNGGDIRITAGSLFLNGGSRLDASTYGEGNVGSVNIAARDAVAIDVGAIFSRVENVGVGNGGNIDITTRTLTLTRGAQLDASVFGRGNAGDIVVNAQDTVALDGELITPQGALGSAIFTEILENAEGDGGNIIINTGSLSVTNGGGIASRTRGRGDAGDITIRARDTVLFEGTGEAGASNATSGVLADAVGAGGNLDITTGSLFVSDGARLNTSTSGEGNAGSITVNARDRIIFNDGRASAFTFGLGNAGSIITNAGNQILLDNGNILSGVGETGRGTGGNVQVSTGILILTNTSTLNASTSGQGSSGSVIVNARDRIALSESGILSSIDEKAVGNGGNIDITTGLLEAANDSLIFAEVEGRGNAGNIIINARDRIAADEETFFVSGVDSRGVGNGGDIIINTGDLSLSGGSLLRATTGGQGNAGNIIINANDHISFIGTAEDGNPSTAAFSNVNQNAVGRAGNIEITADSLSVLDGAQLSSSTEGQGDAGNVIIRVRDRVLFQGNSLDGEFSGSALSTVEENAIGNGGNIEISAESLEVRDGAQLLSVSQGQGNAGNIVINARDRVIFDGESPNQRRSSTATSRLDGDAVGQGGDIRITTGSLFITNEADLNASTLGQGDAGDVIVDARDAIVLDAGGIFSASAGRNGFGQGGTIRLATGSLRFTNGGQILTSAGGRGDAGDVIIDAHNSVFGDGKESNGNSRSGIDSSVLSDARGNGGDITITTSSFSFTNGAEINASTSGQGNAGSISISATDRVTFGGTSAVLGTVEQTGNGTGGNIEITTPILEVLNGATLATNTLGQGNAGNVIISASDRATLDRGFVISTVDATGNGIGGNIEITAPILEVLNGAQLAASSGGQGNAGNISVLASDRIILDGSGSSGFSSGIFTSTGVSSTGRGGRATVITPELRIANGAVISAQTANNRQGGSVVIEADQFTALNGGQVITATSGDGQAGTIMINANQILLSGTDATYRSRLEQFGRTVVNNQGDQSGLFANTQSNSTGSGGRIILNTANLDLNDRARISAQSQGTGAAGGVTIRARDNINLSGRARISTESQGENARAGDIQIEAGNTFTATDSDVSTSAANASGGDIRISTNDVRLFGDSDIRTNSAVNGGNVNIDAGSLIAYDDSDIIASAQNQGGNINFGETLAFFENYNPASANANPNSLENNDSANLNATGATPGIINVTDTSFIQNSLSDLPANAIDPDSLIANSCIARTASGGTFLITGPGGLPSNRPGTIPLSPYATDEVRTEPDAEWQPGDPIMEPQGVYQLPNGELIISRECDFQVE